MKVLLPLAVAVASALMVPTSLAGPSDSAIDNANSNAKFLRCGTEHPSAAALGCSVPQRRNFALLLALSIAESLGPASEVGTINADATATARGRSTFTVCAPLRADPVPSYPWFLREKKRVRAM